MRRGSTVGRREGHSLKGAIERLQEEEERREWDEEETNRAGKWEKKECDVGIRMGIQLSTKSLG